MSKRKSTSTAESRKTCAQALLKTLGESVYSDMDEGKFPSLTLASRSVRNIVYDKNDLGPIGPMGLMALDIDGDPTDKTVRVKANTENIVLTFTDKPIKDAVRKSSGGKKAPGNLGDALLDAVQKAAGLPELP